VGPCPFTQIGPSVVHCLFMSGWCYTWNLGVGKIVISVGKWSSVNKNPEVQVAKMATHFVFLTHVKVQM
jgi:hypothetical protein